VVSEPQNPTAAKREYLPSRFHCYDIMTNAPSTEPTARKTNSNLSSIPYTPTDVISAIWKDLGSICTLISF